MDLHQELRRTGEQALEASRALLRISTARKNRALHTMADALEEDSAIILSANARDLEQARREGLSSAMLERLTLDSGRVAAMAQGLREVAGLPDPVGKRIWRRVRPNGLVIEKRRVPLGVVAIIYESRPNVTADTAALCLKTSNAVILRGGKESFHSNMAIANTLRTGAAVARIPRNAIQLIETTDRAAVRELVRMDDCVDVVIPRGGESLIRAVVGQATVPVLKHYKGVCHIFVDSTADLAMALPIIENAKCQRPGVCNALETLLVHATIAPTLLPALAEIAERRQVELRGCPRVRQLLPECALATEQEWFAEYLDLTLAVRVVDSLEQAIAHINTYGSRHTDAIITRDKRHARRFLKEVDSAAIFVNASTRFTDGGEFGMGAEMGISTDKLHARGPMGLEELTTYKYQITGTGQIR